mmetsp:Transcript_9469/g.15717  ORF Transcript_9469/g.15717 Transcript_9469/m.15717 type:complete len:164 (-) Transcript_9469:63-554(-)
MNEQRQHLQRRQPTEPGDDDDDDTAKILLQKAWCHGQSIAPPLLGGLAVFFSNDVNQSLFDSVIILAIVISWPIISWRAMQHPSAISLRRILIGGAIMLALYAYLFGAIIKLHTGGGIPILLLVFLSLMMMETIAYLAVVWYHRPWFERGPRCRAEGDAFQQG